MTRIMLIKRHNVSIQPQRNYAEKYGNVLNKRDD